MGMLTRLQPPQSPLPSAPQFTHLPVNLPIRGVNLRIPTGRTHSL